MVVFEQVGICKDVPLSIFVVQTSVAADDLVCSWWCLWQISVICLDSTHLATKPHNVPVSEEWEHDNVSNHQRNIRPRCFCVIWGFFSRFNRMWRRHRFSVPEEEMLQMEVFAFPVVSELTPPLFVSSRSWRTDRRRSSAALYRVRTDTAPGHSHTHTHCM